MSKARHETPKQREHRLEYQRARRAANPEKVKAELQKWRAANRERILERQRARRAANPEDERAKQRARRAADPDKIRMQQRAWYWANHAKVIAQDRARREANPEKERAQSRAWRAANRERDRATKRAWYAANLERHKEWKQRPENREVSKRCSIRHRWIVSRLTKMAHDMGLWDQLKKEYDNGKRSIRPTSKKAVPASRRRRKLQNSEGRSVGGR